MTISIGAPWSGERLFLAFVQPCLDARVRASTGNATGADAPRFGTGARELYVEMWRTGSEPSRDMLRRDFPTPCGELERFAASRGVVDPDLVWAHDTVADFRRTASNQSDPNSRALASTTPSTA